MPTEGEKLARVATLLVEVRGDIVEVKAEMQRARERIHKLEGISTSFLAWQQSARESERAQYARLGLRIQVLTIVVGLAAVVAPIVSVLLVGK